MKLFNVFFLIVSIMLILFVGCDTDKGNYFYYFDPSTLPSLRFDGMYQSEPVDDGVDQTWHYVRFYEDGTVIVVWSPGTPEEIIGWFNKENIENGNFGHGQIEIEDDQLVFTATFTNGTVDYEGAFQDDVLILNSHSNINDTDDTRTYTFVALPEE